jgi:hypothetical protein
MKSGLTSINILLTALRTATPIKAVRAAFRADLIEGCPFVVAKHCLMSGLKPKERKTYGLAGSQTMNSNEFRRIIDLQR